MNLNVKKVLIIKTFGNRLKTFRSSHRRCSVKKVFLKLSQNSQETPCARVSFLIKLQASSKIVHFAKTITVNFAKFSSAPFLKEHLPWLLLPFFSNTCFNSTNISLVEENEIVNDGGKIATIMIRYFTNITNKHMNLKANKISHREELVNILDTFKNHKSVHRIKLVKCHSKNTLNFSQVTKSEVELKMVIF